MKNIVILGDSFSFGEGCSDRPTASARTKGMTPSEFAWPSLLRKQFPNDNILNLSVPGNSLLGMFNDILKFRDNVPQLQIDMILATVTSFDRTIIPYYKNHEHGLMNWVLSDISPKSPEEPKEYLEARKSFLKYLTNEPIMNLNGLTQTLALVYYCQFLCGATVLWSVPNPHLIFRQQEYFDNVKSLYFDHMFNFKYCDKTTLTKEFVESAKSADGHPNDLGHKHYYENYVIPKLVPKMREFMRLENVN